MNRGSTWCFITRSSTSNHDRLVHLVADDVAPRCRAVARARARLCPVTHCLPRRRGQKRIPSHDSEPRAPASPCRCWRSPCGLVAPRRGSPAARCGLETELKHSILASATSLSSSSPVALRRSHGGKPLAITPSTPRGLTNLHFHGSFVPARRSGLLATGSATPDSSNMTRPPGLTLATHHFRRALPSPSGLFCGLLGSGRSVDVDPQLPATAIAWAMRDK